MREAGLDNWQDLPMHSPSSSLGQAMDNMMSGGRSTTSPSRRHYAGKSNNTVFL